jgi:hypothetical protein
MLKQHLKLSKNFIQCLKKGYLFKLILTFYFFFYINNQNRFPHPVTLSGMLEMSRMFLPINNNWTRFIHEAERTYESINSDIQHVLMQIANEACRQIIDKKYS